MWKSRLEILKKHEKIDNYFVVSLWDFGGAIPLKSYAQIISTESVRKFLPEGNVRSQWQRMVEWARKKGVSIRPFFNLVKIDDVYLAIRMREPLLLVYKSLELVGVYPHKRKDGKIISIDEFLNTL